MAKITSRIFAFKDFFVAVPAEKSKLMQAVHASNKCPGDFDCFLYRETIEIGFMDPALEEAAGGGLYEGEFWVYDLNDEVRIFSTIAKAMVFAERMWRLAERTVKWER